LPLEEVAEEDFHRHFNINVLGLLLATKEAAKLFGDESGSVINIGSVASDLNSPNTFVYTATKGALWTIATARLNFPLLPDFDNSARFAPSLCL
jgi:3-oxoacyl-[acyl-carrier protein] reductase